MESAQSTAPYDSTDDTRAHIQRVGALMDDATRRLHVRAVLHDRSKLHEPEKSEFDRCTPQLKALVYGTPEYKAALADLAPALDHHYLHNSHHPEHNVMDVEAGAPRVLALENGYGVLKMSLLDLLEMLADWKAAGERHADGGNLRRSLELNTKRFGLSPQLVSIFEATIRELGW